METSTALTVTNNSREVVATPINGTELEATRKILEKEIPGLSVGLSSMISSLIHSTFSLSQSAASITGQVKKNSEKLEHVEKVVETVDGKVENVKLKVDDVKKGLETLQASIDLKSQPFYTISERIIGNPTHRTIISCLWEAVDQSFYKGRFMLLVEYKRLPFICICEQLFHRFLSECVEGMEEVSLDEVGSAIKMAFHGTPGYKYKNSSAKNPNFPISKPKSSSKAKRRQCRFTTVGLPCVLFLRHWMMQASDEFCINWKSAESMISTIEYPPSRDIRNFDDSEGTAIWSYSKGDEMPPIIEYEQDGEKTHDEEEYLAILEENAKPDADSHKRLISLYEDFKAGLANNLEPIDNDGEEKEGEGKDIELLDNPRPTKKAK